MIKERSIVLYIILSIITCGIFGLYWFVCITEDTNAAADVAGTSGGLALLFTIITCGIYGFYWAYKSVKSSTLQRKNAVCLPVTEESFIFCYSFLVVSSLML